MTVVLFVCPRVRVNYYFSFLARALQESRLSWKVYYLEIRNHEHTDTRAHRHPHRHALLLDRGLLDHALCVSRPTDQPLISIMYAIKMWS